MKSPVQGGYGDHQGQFGQGHQGGYGVHHSHQHYVHLHSTREKCFITINHQSL